MLQHSQNFLLDPYLVKKLISSLDIQPNDLIIDIGAGEGIITKQLSNRVSDLGKVIAVELDDTLINTLNLKFSENHKVEIVHEDILKYEFPNTPFKVVANIPFDITSDILTRLLDPNNQLTQANIIMQEEAAKMFGGDDLHTSPSFKSLLSYPYFTFKIIHRFHSSDFMPQPKISIVFLEINKREEPLIPVERWNLYKDFIAYTSADRIGEGAWKKLFSAKQLQILALQSGLRVGNGIKQQTPEAILSAFNSYIQYLPEDKRRLAFGAYDKKVAQDNKISKIHRTRTDPEWFQK